MQTELPLTCGMEFVGVSKVDVLFSDIEIQCIRNLQFVAVDKSETMNRIMSLLDYVKYICLFF